MDPTKLIAVEDIVFELTGHHPDGRALDTTDDATALLGRGVDFIVGSISFATGSALESSVTIGEGFRNEFVPEDEADEARLKELGTARARVRTGANNYFEAFDAGAVDERLIESLASRQIAAVGRGLEGGAGTGCPLRSPRRAAGVHRSSRLGAIPRRYGPAAVAKGIRRQPALLPLSATSPAR